MYDQRGKKRGKIVDGKRMKTKREEKTRVHHTLGKCVDKKMRRKKEEGGVAYEKRTS